MAVTPRRSRWWPFLLAIGSIVGLAGTAGAQDDLPLEPARSLDYTVSSGTFMSLDISPDGETILFDMLGEIYALPAQGGQAVPVATGMAFEVQPTFSPDGKWIAYVSDRSGGDNVWIARADGSDARRITSEDDGAVRTSPAWSADGQSVYVSRYNIRIDRYELWRHPIDGSPAEVVAPVRSSPDSPRDKWQSTLGAAPSRDGRYLYYARRTGDLSFDEPVPWTIMRTDLATGEEELVIGSSGGREAGGQTFFRPAISPNGKLIAYATRRMGKTWLRVRDLTSGEDRPLGLAPLDLMNGAAWLDLIPRYTFSPDSKSVLIAYEGRIERRPVDGSAAVEIPFTARLNLAVGPTTRIAISENTGPVRAKLPQGMAIAPDHQSVAFSAFGKIYVQQLGESRAVPLPMSGDAASMPGWSSDGTRIAYVSWSEASGGHLWVIAADGSASARRLSDKSAFYTNPVFMPGGDAVLVVRSAAAARQQSSFEFGTIRDAQLVMVPLDGGDERVIASGRFGGRPHFVASDPDHAFLLDNSGLVSINLETGAQLSVVSVKAMNYYFTERAANADDIRISPDGEWIAAQTSEQLYIAPLASLEGGAVIDLREDGHGARKITAMGGDYFGWGADGSLFWTVGNFLKHLPSPAGELPDGSRELIAELPRARPQGSILLRGATALTMAEGDRIIEDADILVTGDRIAGIGPRGSLIVPDGAVVRELNGKIVTPGLIDDHDHIGAIRRNVVSFDQWDLRARLAFGVTTSLDPSTLGIDQIAYQDMVDAGLIVSPRLRSTGPALFSKEQFTSLEQTRDVLRRYRDAWGLRNIKQYRGESRIVRQWIAIASRELGLLPTTEGSHNPKLILTQIIDGYAGNEHALPIAPFQEDLLGLYDRMRTSYVATLLINTSGPAAGHYYVSRHDPALDPKVQRFWHPSAIAHKLTHRDWASLEVSRLPALAEDVARLVRAGGLVGMGSHGDEPGIGFHYEMEAHATGGMTPMEILHAATAGAAETIGRLNDMGTLEVGKYADLVVYDRDPRVDIRNTLSVSLVMRGGQLFDADTLEELWPQQQALTGGFQEKIDDRADWLPVDGN